jgi:phosphopentomutase
VARVIARPFAGTSGGYRRTTNRHDFAVPPPEETLLDRLVNCGLDVVTVGKIASIFDGRGVTLDLHARNNDEAAAATLEALARAREGLIFANLGDFDTLWGHRNDPASFARGLAAFDSRLPELLAALAADDCLILTADHGCDPTTPGTDHTREYVPLLVFSSTLRGGIDLGTRASLADTGQTIADNFGLRLQAGRSFLAELR